MSAKTSSNDENAVLQVFIFKEGQFWGSECYAQNIIVVGRSSDIDLELDEDVISRKHARLTIEDDAIRVEDLDSANGTYVNGEPVHDCKISSLDEVSIGSFNLKFKLLGKRKSKPKFDEHTVVSGKKLVVDEEFTEVVSPEELMQEQKKSKQAEEHRLPPKESESPIGRFFGKKDKSSKSRREDSSKPRPQSEPKLPALPDEKDPAIRQKVAKSQTSPPTLPVERIEALPVVPAEPPQLVSPSGTRQIRRQTEEAPLKVERRSVKSEESGSDLSPPGGAQASRQAGLAEILFDKHALKPDVTGREMDADAWIEAAEDDDEVLVEEYQKDFVEPFSLLNNLIRENFSKPHVAVEDAMVVEVISYNRDKCVLGYDQVSRGSRFRTGNPKKELARFKRSGDCRVIITDEMTGGIVAGGRTIKVDDVKTHDNRISKRRADRYAYHLSRGDYANIILKDGGGYFIRFTQPPRIPKPARKWKLDPFSLKILGSVFLAHWIMIVILGLFSKQVVAANQTDIDRFVKFAVKDLALEVQEEEPEIPLDQLPEPEKPAVAPTPQEAPKEIKEEPPKPSKEVKKTPPRSKRRNNRSRQRGDGGGGADKSSGDGGGGVGMMAALGNLSQRKSSQNIVAAVSNIDAVRSPGGRSRYKLSGVVTKLPTSNVVVSQGHGVGVKAGVDLLRGGKGRGGLAGLGPGAIGGGKAGKRAVGGVVFEAPKRRMTVRGHLSREAIAEVVKKHLREIQYCYEKNLLLNPKLAGKLIMEWTITTSGAVSLVKTAQSSMNSPAVALCISGKIKQWKFPQPKGGIVVVTYPFIFNSIGF